MWEEAGMCHCLSLIVLILRKAEGQGTVMTVEKAVNLLTQEDVDTQVSAASFLQLQCFNSTEAKRKVNSPSSIGVCYQSMRYALPAK